jgi:hypothetical protein
MSIHAHWQAGSEESALEAGVIDALNGGHWRPPTDYADAYNQGFEDAKSRAPDHAREQTAPIEAHQLAILGLIHLVIYADKDVDPGETAWLYEEARYHPVFSGIPFVPFRTACLGVLHDIHERPADELMDIWTSVARSHPRETLELAAGAMLADGVVALPEEGCISALIAKLGSTREEAAAVFIEAFGLSGKK